MHMDNSNVIRVGLILVEMFPLYGAVLATESMRLANVNADLKIFDWTYVSEEGGPVAASNGMSIATSAAADIGILDYAFVIAGYDQGRKPLPRIKGLLRRLSRHGAVIGAVDSGAFLLAEAGLLAGQTAAVHLKSRPSFEAMYPDIELTDAPVSISPKVMACAGGASVTRFILFIMRERVGDLIASKFEADLYQCAMAFPPDTPNHKSQPRKRLGIDHIVNLMVESIDAPLTLKALAHRSGVSVRQLNRTFHDRFNVSPMKHYLRLRLASARQQLYQGIQPMSDVALSSGFTALSAFSRAFKAEFGQAPSKLLSTFRREGFARIISSPAQSADLDLAAPPTVGKQSKTARQKCADRT